MANLPSAAATIPLVPLIAIAARDLLGFAPFPVLAKNSERLADLLALFTLVFLGGVLRLLLGLGTHLSRTQTCIVFFLFTLSVNVVLSYVSQLFGFLSFSTLPYLAVAAMLAGTCAYDFQFRHHESFAKKPIAMFLVILCTSSLFARFLAPHYTPFINLADMLIFILFQALVVVTSRQYYLFSNWLLLSFLPLASAALLNSLTLWGLYESHYGRLLPNALDAISVGLILFGTQLPEREESAIQTQKQETQLTSLVAKADQLYDRLRFSETVRSFSHDRSGEFVELISGMSKVIRDFCQPLLTNTDLLSHSSHLDPGLRNWVSEMVEATNAIINTVQNTADFTKAEYGNLVIDKSVSFRPDELIERILDSEHISKLLESIGNVEFFTYIDPNVPSGLLGDPKNVELIVGHLISNSIQNTTQGEIKVSVIRNQPISSSTECSISFIVKDTGFGISPELLQHIQNPFRAKLSSEKRGSGPGLGIPICDRTARMFEGGELKIKSEIGSGTEVTFRAIFKPAAQVKPFEPQWEKILFIGSEAQVFNYSNLVNRNGYRMFKSFTTVETACMELNDANHKDEPYQFVITNNVVNSVTNGPMEASAALAMVEKATSTSYTTLVLMSLAEYKARRPDWATGYMIKPLRMKLLRASMAKYRNTKPRRISTSEPTQQPSIHVTPPSPPAEITIAASLPPPIEPTNAPEPTPASLAPTPAPRKVPAGVGSPTMDRSAEKRFPLETMVVEDNELTRKVLVGLLSNHKVYTAANGNEAVQVFRDKSFAIDLIFMDLYMPQLDGFQATKLIRKMEKEQHQENQCMIVGITADDGNHQNCLDVGMDLCLIKPVSMKSMAEVVAKATARKLEAQDSTQTPAKTPRKQRPMRVLVADDNEASVKCTQKVFEARGMVVDTASNGAEALDKIKANHSEYDLILMDILMPLMDGIECTIKVRELESQTGLDKVPILALTGTSYTSEEISSQRNRCLGAGFDDYLQKPLNYPAIIDSLSSYRAEREASKNEARASSPIIERVASAATAPYLPQ